MAEIDRVASAISFLQHSLEARTVTGTLALIELAGQRLREAGLDDLAEHAEALADSFAAPEQAVRELIQRIERSTSNTKV
jgi:hypothetical protein